MFEGIFNESLLKKAVQKKIVSFKILNLRSFTNDKHHTVDDRPFGGGAGMVLKIEPVYKALAQLKKLQL